VVVYSRRGQDITDRVPTLAGELRALPPGILDAEPVLPRDDGRCDFNGMLAAVLPGPDARLSLWAVNRHAILTPVRG
jgi:ATP-dependent DNA ligase